MKDGKKYTFYFVIFLAVLLVPFTGMLITGPSKSESSSAARLPAPVIVSEDENKTTLNKDYLKQLGEYPKRKFQCVYSDELLTNKGHNATCGTGQCVCPKAKMGPGDPSLLNHEWCSSKAQINGTVAHITAIFGFMLASLVIRVSDGL